MRYLSLCSGIEAASVAWHDLGWTPVGFSEIEPFPAAVLAHRFPNVKNYGDMTKYEAWDYAGMGAVDIMVAGTPCQSFSSAGLRKGLEDPRGNLMLTYLSIVERVKPRWIVWENVPGVLSSNGGRDFGTFLRALGELGYGWAYRVLDAQYVRVGRWHKAVPQRRRRVFVVGCLGDWRAPAEILALADGLRWHIEASGKTRKSVAADAESGAGGSWWWDGSDCAATLTKQNAGGGQRMPDKDNTGAVLQPIVIDRAAFNQGQNAQYDPVIREDGAMPSMVARGPHAVAVPFRKSKCEPMATIDMQACKGNANVGDGSVSPTLCKPSGNDVHAVAFTRCDNGQDAAIDHTPTMRCGSNYSAHLAVAFPIDTQNMTEGHSSGGLRFGQSGDPSFTVTKGHSHAVAHSLRADGFDASEDGTGRGTPLVPVAPSLLASGTGVARTGNENTEVEFLVMSSGQAGNAGPTVSSVMAVRRLTPRECERLQGFPDDWTLIPWRGKPAEQCPDGPRYKAIGNSMACNCMAWIGERIQAYITATTSSDKEAQP